MPIDVSTIKTEEDRTPLASIINGFQNDARADGSEYLDGLRRSSLPALSDICADILDSLSLHSETNLKSEAALRDKCARPATIERYPWFRPRHVRDYLRFRTHVNSMGEIARVITLFERWVASNRISIVKVDTRKLIHPGIFGWRMIAIDLRILSTGMLVEHYMTFSDLIHANQDWLHALYERWRSRGSDDLSLGDLIAFDRDCRISTHAYRELMIDALANEQDGNAILRVRRGVTEIALNDLLETGITIR